MISAPPFEAVADVWHPQRPEGMAAVIVREAASLKQSYLIESVFIRYCAERAGEPVTRQFVDHLEKSYVYAGGEVEGDALFVSADVTRRVRLMFGEHEKQLDALQAELVSDPTLERYSRTMCSRPHTCRACSIDLPRNGDDHITNLYRGGELAGKLLDEGYESIIDVPAERLGNQKQRIQHGALVSRTPHVDTEALSLFLESISYPLHYLDFEAVNSAVPRYSGTTPWEHVPYLFSVHSECSPGADPKHRWFLMDPHRDQRRELLGALLTGVGGGGTVLVYGAQFETGILRRLAENFPEQSERVLDVIGRIADLLQPFSEFSYYNHRQRGKVSLKTVLPILTDETYSGLAVKDGYTANLAFRYLGTVGDSVAANRTAAALSGDLVRYCTKDTLAMVRIVDRLRQIVAEREE